MDKKLIIVAGPNGSGKTTFTNNVFSSYVHKNLFLNADIIAQNLSPVHVGKADLSAGKIFLKKFERLLDGKESFVIETTLSGKLLLKKIETAQKKGFSVDLFFLWVSSPSLCDFRVKGRVASGGHNIPIDIIERRQIRGLKLLPLFLKVVDTYRIYIADDTPHLFLFKSPSGDPQIVDQAIYEKFRYNILKES